MIMFRKIPAVHIKKPCSRQKDSNGLRNSSSFSTRTYCLRLLVFGLILWQITQVTLSSVTIRQLYNQATYDTFYIPQQPDSWQYHTTEITVPNDVHHQLQRTNKRLLVIAAVPRDMRHIYTLWSELECFTSQVDHVIISAPTWSVDIIEDIVGYAKAAIPQFSNEHVTIETQYYINDRYDVGLWCDALKSTNNINEYDEYGIVNDSVFALREFTEVFDTLKSKNVSLSSINYSYSAKYFRGYGPQYYWVESVFRGLDTDGLKTFIDHSCVPSYHPYYCREKSKAEQKACIINNFEHDLAPQFPRDKVWGLYESDAPTKYKVYHYKMRMTWANNPLYWKQLVDEMNFPVAKENIPQKIPNLNSTLLSKCTRYISMEQIELLNLDFSVAMSSLK